MASDRAKFALELLGKGATFIEIARDLQVSPQRARKLVHIALMDELRENGFGRNVANNMAKHLARQSAPKAQTRSG